MSDVRKELSEISLKASAKSWRRKVRWAITDKTKFHALVKELEGIVDLLFDLAPPSADISVP